MRQWILLGPTAAALLAVGFVTAATQELPPGGGAVPPLRRGANGQIEIVPPSAPAPAGNQRRGTRPAAIAPKAGSPGMSGSGRASSVRRAAPLPPSTPQPVITVMPDTPRVPDTTRPGAVVATYSVKMSDGSPFAGTVRFGPPHYDGKGVFALSGNNIIVNPQGPGLGHSKTTVIDHITLQAVP
jgi:hypothetical protein